MFKVRHTKLVKEIMKPLFSVAKQMMEAVKAQKQYCADYRISFYAHIKNILEKRDVIIYITDIHEGELRYLLECLDRLRKASRTK